MCFRYLNAETQDQVSARSAIPFHHKIFPSHFVLPWTAWLEAPFLTTSHSLNYFLRKVIPMHYFAVTTLWGFIFPPSKLQVAFPKPPKTKRHKVPGSHGKVNFSSAEAAATFFSAAGVCFWKLCCASHFAFVFMLPHVDMSNTDIFTWMSHCRLLLESVGGKRYFKCDSSHLKLDAYDQLDELHPQRIHFLLLTARKFRWSDQVETSFLWVSKLS